MFKNKKNIDILYFRLEQVEKDVAYLQGQTKAILNYLDVKIVGKSKNTIPYWECEKNK